jgi:hypothetical protein
MKEAGEIVILGESIPTSQMRIPIDQLNYNKDNPRVYTIMERLDKKLVGEELNEKIFEIMLEESSVINIQQDIKENKGLTEPIMVRRDTNVVVEGNSRLTVYKFLNDRDRQNNLWQSIDCIVVASLTEKQQDSYLNDIHMKGKTPWTAYEKAKLIYKKYHEGVSIDELTKERFKGTTEKTINHELWVIDEMKNNNDDKADHYSSYAVLRKTTAIRENLLDKPENKPVLKMLTKQIKETGTETGEGIKAMSIRDKLPTILKSKKHTKKLLNTGDLDGTFRLAKTTDFDKKLEEATETLKDIHSDDVKSLTQSDLSKLEYTFNKKLMTQIKLIEKYIELANIKLSRH